MQQLFDVAALGVGGRASLHHASLVEHGEALGEGPSEIQTLLDEQDRRGLLSGSRGAQALFDLLYHRRLHTFGRLIEDEQLWTHHQRTAHGELLLLSTAQVAA
ncbi:MAG: hypothetical protein R2724_14625 [Bryobacterales bacterium]